MVGTVAGHVGITVSYRHNSLVETEFIGTTEAQQLLRA